MYTDREALPVAGELAGDIDAALEELVVASRERAQDPSFASGS